MGRNGLLIGFCGDVWDLNSVRNVMWLQRHTYKLMLAGIEACIIIPNHTYELTSFYMSIPRTIPFQVLADPEARVYAAYNIQQPSYVYLDRKGQQRMGYTIQHGTEPQLHEVVPIG